MGFIKNLLFGPGEINLDSIMSRIFAGAMHILGFGLVFSLIGLFLWLVAVVIGSFEEFILLFFFFIVVSYTFGVYLFKRWQ
jgi:hypothetical protein